MKVIGITGGIGMGKSTSGELLRQRNIPVIDTDTVAREIVEPGEPALDEITTTFGRDVLDAAGRLNRAELARRVFSHSPLREQLEAILHPRIRERWLAQILAWRTQGHGAAVVIIPLLFETNAQEECDATLCVACSPKTQHQRLAARGWTSEQITQRLAAQWPTPNKIEAADFLVWTESSLETHAAQLDRILKTMDN